MAIFCLNELMEKEIKVENENMTTRLDVYLKRILGEFSRNQIIEAIDSGNITVNGKTVKPKYLVRNNDIIRVDQLEKKKTTFEVEPAKGKLDIIYEDQNLIVINKPAGLGVHPSFSNTTENTLVNYLLNYFPAIRGVGEDPMRPGIVHRLDKDTSWVMVVAKNQDTFLKLKHIFKAHLLKKVYLTLAIGIFKEKDGYINYPLTIAKTFGKFRRAKQDELAEGLKNREAHTQYHVLHEYKNKYSFLEIIPLTGRTHQIRVHLLTVGRPVAGDRVYGSNLDDLGLKRQFLHASRLEFTLDNTHYSFFVPLPQDLVEALHKITH